MNKEMEADLKLKKLLQKAESKTNSIPQKKLNPGTWLSRALLALLFILMICQFNINLTPKSDQAKSTTYYKIEMPSGIDQQPTLIPVSINTPVAQAQEDSKVEFAMFMGCSKRTTPKPKVYYAPRINNI